MKSEPCCHCGQTGEPIARLDGRCEDRTACWQRYDLAHGYRDSEAIRQVAARTRATTSA